MDYWKNICEIQKKQTEKGLKTYGQRLEDNKSLNSEQKITMLEEELIDGLMYCEHIKASEHRTITQRIQDVAENICDHFCCYRNTCDDNCECEWIRQGNKCPLHELY